MIIQESYLLPFAVKSIVLSQTIHHISSKSLIAVTRDNQVYQIDHMLYTARRPHTDTLGLTGATPDEEKKEGILELKSVAFPPYDAVIAVNPHKYLSYGMNLVDLRTVKSFSTRLESTSQVLVYGFDLFFVRVSPDLTFDLLQENFNYTLLFTFIGGLFITMVLVKMFIDSKTKQNNFLMS